MRALTFDDWRALEAAHHARVDALVADHLSRRSRGEKHPVEDFLYVYYRFRPGRLRRWHPGAGVVLRGDDPDDRASWPHYRATASGVTVDALTFLESHAARVDAITSLLRATAERAPQLGCFGLHEWAMVYRLEPDQVRHDAWPLRLGRDGTDAVVEASQVRCSHYDAFRFFTPAATSRNLLQPQRDTQIDMEQPGCLHATMDLYKWCFSLAPAISSGLTVDAFELAREARALDMRASPYDLRALGFSPIAVETSSGRAEYVAQQRYIAAKGSVLRSRLIDELEQLTSAPAGAAHVRSRVRTSGPSGASDPGPTTGIGAGTKPTPAR